MRIKNKRKLLLGFTALLAYGAAHASQTDSNTGTLSVTTAISPECAVAQKTALNIPQLTMLNTSTAAQDTTTDDKAAGALNAICTNGTQTPQFRFSSANTSGSDFRLVGTDATTFIVYTLWEGATASGTQIAHNTNAAFGTFTADGTQQVLNLSMKVAGADRAGASIQNYSDTITVTTSYGP
ncbi:MAG: spore coat protein U domain-containing protein [Telluria sp.]